MSTDPCCRRRRGAMFVSSVETVSVIWFHEYVRAPLALFLSASSFCHILAWRFMRSLLSSVVKSETLEQTTVDCVELADGPADLAVKSQLAQLRKWRNWQTHQLEGLALARAWGFESPLPHQILSWKSGAGALDASWPSPRES